MRHHAILHNIIQYLSILCNSLQYHTIPFQFYAIVCNTTQYKVQLQKAQFTRSSVCRSTEWIVRLFRRSKYRWMGKTKKRCWNVFLKPLPLIVCCLSPPMVFKSVPPMVYVGARKSFWYLFLVTKTSKSPLKCWQENLFIPWFTVCPLNMDAKKKWFLPWFTVCHPACLPSPPTPEQVGVGGEGGEKV